MSDVAIRVENLGKKYKIGANQARYQTIRESLTDVFHNSFHALKGKKSQEENIIWALKDIDFEVKHGEVLGIIGRNGAGKSTLLKILARITKPTTGRIELNGRVGSLLEVGTGFHPELTGRENIFLSGAILGMKRQEIIRKFDEIVDFAEIEKFLDTPVKHYSSGMYMRLAFAVAAHLDPEILTIDEVLAVGDAQFQKKCLGKMGDVAKEGRTVLFVSHNLLAIQNLCKRGILITQGHITEDSLIHEVISSYLDSSAKLLDLDLSARDDRTGVGRVRFVNIEFFDCLGKRITSAKSGDDLHIRLHYDAPPNQLFQKARFSIGVDKNGLPFFVASTEITVSEQVMIHGPGWTECKIERLPLAEGNYQLTLFCEAGGEIQDWIRDAITLTVGGGDFYGTGRTAPKGHEGMYVLVPYEWKFM